MISTDVYNITREMIKIAYEIELGNKPYEITCLSSSDDHRMLCNVARILPDGYTNQYYGFCRLVYNLTCKQFVSTIMRLLAYSQKHSSDYADECYSLASSMLETIGIELI